MGEEVNKLEEEVLKHLYFKGKRKFCSYMQHTIISLVSLKIYSIKETAIREERKLVIRFARLKIYRKMGNPQPTWDPIFE